MAAVLGLCRLLLEADLFMGVLVSFRPRIGLLFGTTWIEFLRASFETGRYDSGLFDGAEDEELELFVLAEFAEAEAKIFFLLLLDEVTDEAENVRTLRAVDRTGRDKDEMDDEDLVGDEFACLAAFSASSSALALIYFLSQSRTPLRFLCAEQVSLVQGLDSVKSRMAMARALPESS